MPVRQLSEAVVVKLTTVQGSAGVGVTAAIPVTVDHYVAVRGVLALRVVEELPISQAKSRLAIRPHNRAGGKRLRLAAAGDWEGLKKLQDSLKGGRVV